MELRTVFTVHFFWGQKISGFKTNYTAKTSKQVYVKKVIQNGHINTSYKFSEHERRGNLS